MVTRRQAREWAVMMLCECDLNPPESLEVALAAFWDQQADIERDRLEANEYGVKKAFCAQSAKNVESLAEMKEFAEARIRGVLRDREAIDAELEPFLEHWSLYRLGTVERNVLRLGAWELSRCPDIPAPISINEAVDLAKFYSETQSGKFVNGVLDRYAKSLLERPFTPRNAKGNGDVRRSGGQ